MAQLQLARLGKEETMVRVELDRSAALVLYDFLSRFDESDQLRIDAPAEKYVLWALHGC